jgi:hypothetical protein
MYRSIFLNKREPFIGVTEKDGGRPWTALEEKLIAFATSPKKMY